MTSSDLPSGDLAAMEFSPDQMLAMGNAVVARSVAHLAAIGIQPSCGDVDAATLCRSLREPVPEAGTHLEPLLDLLFNDLIPRSFTTPSPGYLAYIPGGGVYPAALADFIADTTNRYTGVWVAAPALVQLEANVLEWLRDWMGFPVGTAGLLTTGGSGATFNAIVCARERLLGDDIRPGTLYTSTQGHHCINKAAKLAGIAADRVRLIPVDREYRMDVAALRAAIAHDRAQGLRPFFVASAAGTTNTGAVDPLDDIADVCAQEHVWHHVDGAYGAFFHMCPELRPLLLGLSRADSLTLDPHKGMFLPYGTGALLVRDGNTLRSVHSATAGYLPDNQDEFYDPAQYGPELSRGFPGLRVWLSVKLYGAARYRAAVAEKRVLALWAAERVTRIPGIVMDAAPQLSLFAFHLEGPTLTTQAARNVATETLVQRVTARGKVMITGCTVDGRYLARVCVLSFRTRMAEMETCVQHLADEAAGILSVA
ncbi:MAG: aminotransferase class V-fold PLP-dependent enzyme [Gemmatimonadaceae bacterium]|nr:aminotransferase class V-fold PLP-dependent enzyme [Gemmatimonadaceae bacterium]